MHSPETVAFQIRNPFAKNKYSYLITIWHIDPETDHTDDSCGWFMRSRHLPVGLLEKVVKEYETEWDRTWTSNDDDDDIEERKEKREKYTYYMGWFNPQGENIMSVRGIVANMYLYAVKICLNPDDKIDPGKAWDKAWKFMNKNYAQIMYFAENNRDSIRDTIVRKFSIGTGTRYTPEKRNEMIRECATIVTTDVMRKLRPWYKHPRWHIRHWRIKFHPFQNLKRRYWDKCCICGKRGFKGAAYGDWDGTKLWHEECDQQTRKSPTPNE